MFYSIIRVFRIGNAHMKRKDEVDIEYQKLVETLYNDLEGLIWSMAWEINNPDRWQLEAREVFGDLVAELAKVVASYYGRKDYKSLYYLCIKSLRNRKNDLLSMAYLTNRKNEAIALSLDDLEDTVGESEEYFDLDAFLDELSNDAKKLVFEALWPSPKTIFYTQLTAARKDVVSPSGKWKITITPLILRRSLGWSERRVNSAWKQVSDVLSNV